MRFDVKLSQQGFILIAVPLAFELLFVGTLFYILDQAEQTLIRERHSKQIVAEFKSMTTQSFDLALKFNEFVSKNDSSAKDVVKEKLEDLETHMHRLQELVAGDAEQESRLQKILPFEENLINSLRNMIALHDADRNKYLQQSGMIATVLTRDVSSVVDQTNDFMEAERSSIQENELAKLKSMVLIKEWLIFGLCTNIVLASWLVFSFNRRTNRRLKVLVDNTVRMTRNLPLNERLSGGDELAAIDASFHGMATSLTEATRLKQQVVAMISHDLRTPLTSLQMLLSLFSQGYYDAGPIIKERSLSAELDIARLVALINDLIEIDKFESGAIKLKLELTPLAKVFDVGRNSVSTLASESSVTIRIDDTALEILADQDRLTRVIVNLLSNAIKFSPPSGQVEIAAVKQGDETVMVRVRDQGRGVPQEKMASIFDRFSQVEQDDEDKKGGSGLGLTICKQIVEAHGGTIGVESNVGEGSTFWFKLPLH